MTDCYEIDFLGAEAAKSIDAITMRYRLGDRTSIHVIDGGIEATGHAVVDHVRRYHGDPAYIDRSSSRMRDDAAGNPALMPALLF